MQKNPSSYERRRGMGYKVMSGPYELIISLKTLLTSLLFQQVIQ